MKQLSSEQKIILLEHQIKFIEKYLFVLAKAHFGDTQELATFMDKYKADIVLNYPEACK